MKPYRIHSFYILASFNLVFCSVVSAQNENLDELRGIYFEQIKKVSIPIDKKYGQSLVKLQKTLISENKLEEALSVKNEIARLKAKLAGNQAPEHSTPLVLAPSTTTKPEMTEAKPLEQKSQKFNWLGDFQMKKIEGERVIFMEADEADDITITAELKNVQKDYPNGAVWRFLYKSEDYSGIGLNIIFDFPALRVLSRTGTAVRPNGNWIERTRVFSDFKGEDRVNFKIQLLKGTGGIYLKEISILPN